MPKITFDRYYRYDELTQLLKDFAAEHPDLVRISSIGKSHEGRETWLATVSDSATGPDAEKPAFWCDGNIHASEVSASTAVLLLIERLVTVHRNLLREHTFYLVPRVNPDGAEWALEMPPRIIRSSTRPYPYDEEDPYGLERKDMDGDGRILNMRVPDANGPWKICPEEPRILVRREPGETGGQYYRVLPEGLFHNFDGLTMRSQKVKEGLDMNRNFPNAWRQEFEQHGAGLYPTSEPEVANLVKAITSRSNICGAVTFHTFSGVNLRPPSRFPDDDLPTDDLWRYQEIGKKGLEMTGYPGISVYHDFRYHPKEVITGTFDDWMFEHCGVYAWTTEIWSPQRQAGITDYKYTDWHREHPLEDDLKMLKWSDEKLGGRGYIDWKPFHHPQLGDVEIGGWDAQYAFRNPPAEFLEKELTPLSEWVVWQAGCAPILKQRNLLLEPVGEHHVRIRFAVQNTGWLPTSVTKIAVERKLCRGVVGEIIRKGDNRQSAGSSSPDWLVSGLLRQDAGQLNGWSHVPAGGFGWHADGTGDVAVFEWVVERGATYELTAKHERAGVVRASVNA